MKDLISKKPNPEAANHLSLVLRTEDHILISVDGPFHNVLKFKPPLCFTLENANTLLEALNKHLDNLDTRHQSKSSSSSEQ